MSEELTQTTFDYNALDADTQVFLKVKAEAIQSRLKRTAEDIIAIGQDLKAVQERLSNHHQGTFRLWIKTEFDMSDRSAYRFIHVAERFSEVSCGKLPQPSASVLYELAAPSTSNNIIEQVQTGQIPATLEAIKAAKKAEEEAKKEAESSLAREKAAQQQLFTLQSQSQNSINKLNAQIAELQDQIATMSKPEVQVKEVVKEVEKRIEVIPDHVQAQIKQLADLKEKVSTLTQQRDSLAEEARQLGEEARNRYLDTQRERADQTKRRNWRSAASTFHSAVSALFSQIPSAIDRQIFEPDDYQWTYQLKEDARRLLEELDRITMPESTFIIDAVV